jgi:RNA polymerase sigma-70 factor (ECF subfamily)
MGHHNVVIPKGASDQELIRRALTGDQLAYRGLVDRYVRPAMAVAWEFTETLEDAEDVVQEAFRRVVNALDTYDTNRPFRPWFFAILRNLARNAAGARALRVTAALDEAVPDERPTPLDVVEKVELQARLDMELESLSEMQRVCFRLCALEGLGSNEVAEALGLSDATVRTHVYRARNALRDAMEPFKEEGGWKR